MLFGVSISIKCQGIVVFNLIQQVHTNYKQQSTNREKTITHSKYKVRDKHDQCNRKNWKCRARADRRELHPVSESLLLNGLVNMYNLEPKKVGGACL